MRRVLACWAVAAYVAQGSLAAAETRLSRARALALARQMNPQVVARRAEQSEAEARKGQADAALWPSLELTVGSGPATKAALAPGSDVGSTRSAYDFDWSDLTVFVAGQVRLLQPLYTFGKIGLRRVAAEYGIQAARARTRMTQAEVALEVARLYEAYLFARDAELLYKEGMRVAENAIERAKARRAEGSPDFREVDLLRLQLGRAAVALALTRSRAGMSAARAGLEAFLGLSPGQKVSFEEASLEPVGRPRAGLEGLIEMALRQRPELRALAEGEAAYHALARAERAGYLPDFFALGQVTAAYTPGRDLVSSRYYVDPLHSFVPAVLLGARWTLQANTPGQRAREREARAAKLRALLSWARAGIPAEVRVAQQGALRAQIEIDETVRALPSAKQWMVRASADYAAGLGEARDLTDAVTAYLSMRTAQLDAIRRLNVSLAGLSKAIGSLADGTGPYPGKK